MTTAMQVTFLVGTDGPVACSSLALELLQHPTSVAIFKLSLALLPVVSTEPISIGADPTVIIDNTARDNFK
jgi:hypothetical protein